MHSLRMGTVVDAPSRFGSVGLPSRCGQQLVPSLRRGSGYEQAKAELRSIESDEVAVAFGPPA